MEHQSPAPDLNRSLAALCTAMDTGRMATVWVPARFFFTGYVPLKGRVIRLRPEEGSGRWWLVTIDPPDSPVQEYFLKLDEWPRATLA